ncbi:hypothetical protein CAPTEDRAFT_207667 [Capitella teleta]|uniref:Uncharacterized protein n=1 Tax=Capitella teleta TaxID=283909 RepID=R7V2E9_CAPTE|nr:hypothetical protein CAPTEDRAFT_207667 [Capitella teleta]|eukprot:ELU09881.1 hypothetical protein CAPTEDRAFT_207667 [Capitella teleta]
MLRFLTITSHSSTRPSSASQDDPPPEGLPDPSKQATPEAAAECRAANEEILKLTPEERTQSKKRGSHRHFDDEKRLKIAEDANMNGLAGLLRGSPVNRSITMATARGILKVSKAKTDLTPGSLRIPWAVSLLRRMGYVQRKGTKAAKKVLTNLDKIRAEFHERIKIVVTDKSIPSGMPTRSPVPSPLGKTYRYPLSVLKQYPPSPNPS